jgi:hypothetical protein
VAQPRLLLKADGAHVIGRTHRRQLVRDVYELSINSSILAPENSVPTMTHGNVVNRADRFIAQERVK